MFASIKSGDWLTVQRIRVYPVLLLVPLCLAIILWIGLSDGLLDRNGKPLGTDFSNVWSAGALTLKGRPEAAYDLDAHYKAQRDTFGGRDVPYYAWHYPPPFLAIAELLALLPYGAGLIVWIAATLPLYLAPIRAILANKEVLLVALAFPAVFINIGHGHNGFVTAGLLAGGLLLLQQRPWLAGVLFGLLSYKPHFGLLIPLVLLATGRFQTFASAAITTLVLAGLSVLAFGPETWAAFAESLAYTRGTILETGATGWHKIQSLFSAVRMWGGDVPTAYILQTFLAAGLATSLVWLWRSGAAFALQAAALITASLLVTPYVLDYDMVVLAPALAWFTAHGFAHGFRDYEKSALAFVWLAPLLTRTIAAATSLPLGLFAMVLLYGLILRRAALDLNRVPLIQWRSSLARP